MKKNILLILALFIVFVGCDDTKESKNNQEKVINKEITPLEKIEGEWYYTDAFGNNRVYAVNKKNQFTDNLDSKSYGTNSKVTDTGSSLKFDNGTYTFDIEYPKITNNCFDFKLIKKDDKPIKNANAIKLCKLDNSVENFCGNYYKKDTIDFFIKLATPYGKKPENISFDCDKVPDDIAIVEEYKVFEAKRLKEILKPYSVWSQRQKEIEEEINTIKSDSNKENKKSIIMELKKEKWGLVDIKEEQVKSLKLTKFDYNNLKTYHQYQDKINRREYRVSEEYDYIFNLISLAKRAR